MKTLPIMNIQQEAAFESIFLPFWIKDSITSYLGLYFISKILVFEDMTLFTKLPISSTKLVQNSKVRGVLESWNSQLSETPLTFGFSWNFAWEMCEIVCPKSFRSVSIWIWNIWCNYNGLKIIKFWNMSEILRSSLHKSLL